MSNIVAQLVCSCFLKYQNVKENLKIGKLYMYICTVVEGRGGSGAEFLISCEAWTKLAQKWSVCAPMGIHLEPINKELMLLVTT